jgi:RNA polymerase sigma-70 factor, ECF subfamily
VASQLVERARKGDAAAFEALVEARVGPMTRTAMAILGREDEALDAAGDALVIAWRELASLRDPAALDTWLTRILVHRCKRGLRRVALPTGREVPIRKPGVPAQPAAGTAGGASAGWSALEQAFDRLSIDERMILVLHHLDGCPPAEAAAALKIRVGTAGSRLLAARHALEQSLAQGTDGERQGVADETLGAVLQARADRLHGTAAATVMTRLGAELRAPRSSGILGWLPIGDRAGSMSGWVGWAIALAAAVLVMALLGGR